MKAIRKNIKFGFIDNQKMYYEKYDNYKEFIDTILRRQNENPNKSLKKCFEDNDEDWIGVRSIDEAMNYLLNGWDKEVEKLKTKINSELNSIERKTKMKTFANIQGFMPIVPNAIMRLPNSMIDIRMEAKKSKILSFMICIDRACLNSVEKIISAMSKQLAIIASLERSGQYRCRIEVVFFPFSDDESSKKTICPCSVMVKRESQPFDVKRLAYPVIHPSMLRLLMFAWEGSLPMKYEDYHVCGLGRSFEWWNEKYKQQITDAIIENNEKTIVVDLETDLEKLLKEGGVK